MGIFQFLRNGRAMLWYGYQWFWVLIFKNQKSNQLMVFLPCPRHKHKSNSPQYWWRVCLRSCTPSGFTGWSSSPSSTRAPASPSFPSSSGWLVLFGIVESAWLWDSIPEVWIELGLRLRLKYSKYLKFYEYLKYLRYLKFKIFKMHPANWWY